jgi:hypothetical protein
MLPHVGKWGEEKDFHGSQKLSQPPLVPGRRPPPLEGLPGVHMPR